MTKEEIKLKIEEMLFCIKKDKERVESGYPHPTYADFYGSTDIHKIQIDLLDEILKLFKED